MTTDHILRGKAGRPPPAPFDAHSRCEPNNPRPCVICNHILDCVHGNTLTSASSVVQPQAQATPHAAQVALHPIHEKPALSTSLTTRGGGRPDEGRRDRRRRCR